MSKGFVNPRDPSNHSLLQKVREWLMEFGALRGEDQVTLQDVPCLDLGCPDRETLIEIQAGAQLEVLRIRKPIIYIRKWDIEFALHQKRNKRDN